MADTLTALRSLMASHSPPLDALLVPSEDYHQSEYVSARDKRRAFVSGFTGSAGLALVTKNEALLWTDGRYFLQAEQQLSDQWRLMRMGEDPSVDIWISTTLPEGSAIGIDFWCISVETAQKWKPLFAKKQQNLVPTTRNLVDEVWKDQPQAEINPVHVHPLKFSGRSVSDKLKDLRDSLKKEKARGIIITSLDEVVWLFNVRGSDVSYSPVVHAFAVVTTNSAFFYVDKRKLSSEVKSYLEENKVIVKDYSAVSSDVALLASNQLTSANDTLSNGASGAEVNSHKIWVDPRCCYSLYSRLNPDQVLLQPSPLALPKSLKPRVSLEAASLSIWNEVRLADIPPSPDPTNRFAISGIYWNPVEMEGLKNAHIRDGAAVVQYFAWLDKQMQEIYGASGYFKESESQKSKKHLGDAKLTEVSVSDKLEEFRAAKEHFRGLSFPTISSVGPNGAIIHYGPKAETCAELDPNSMYLCDSGAQYLDGTTDITRTVHFGKPSEHEKRCYTAVLKGHFALGNARFPNGTTGHALDVLARVPLWSYGLDYRHGTGHGIGSYLNVHEGPHSISFRPGLNVPLQASMTVTDEPGYYEDGKFGIRLENVLIIKEAATQFNYANKGYLEFEHITWAPYQTKLIDVSLLLPEEIKWVNSYHMKCREILAPYLNESEKAWLHQATEPIAA